MTSAAHTYPIQCSALHKNGFAVLKGKPCKIVDMSTSKTGKHGHAKVNLVGLDIFYGKKCEDMCPSTHKVQVPVVKKTEFMLINVQQDDFVSLMDDAGNVRSDLKLPEGSVGEDIKAKFEKLSDMDTLMVTVFQCMGNEMIKSGKIVK